ncbi:hypothetical protein EON63_16330 [archaeon]|nr:MAG: hypothetical protein EON63_16330 [archaeon]
MVFVVYIVCMCVFLCVTVWCMHLWCVPIPIPILNTPSSPLLSPVLQQLKDACSNSGARCGVYSSASQWSAIFGSSSFSYGSDLPLWYVLCTNICACSVFV